jgi:hypothetical protein
MTDLKQVQKWMDQIDLTALCDAVAHLEDCADGMKADEMTGRETSLMRAYQDMAQAVRLAHAIIGELPADLEKLP